MVIIRNSARRFALIEDVWGAGADANALVPTGVQFINGGGSWAEGLLYLARSSVNAAPLIDANGNLTLSSFVLDESGWSSDTSSDVLRGGDGNDRLVGGHGSDVLDGGNGTDLAALAGDFVDFRFALTNGGATVVMTNAFTLEVDLLSNIEVLQVGSAYYDVAALVMGAMPSAAEMGLPEVQLLGIAGT